jgi:putative tryptophan/tyrosine transport system substrate-binding protein
VAARCPLAKTRRATSRLHLDRCPRNRREQRADLGDVVGRNLLLEERYANGNPERVPGLIAELLTLNVDILLTPGTSITFAAQRATSMLPIVSVTGDPVRTGLATSLARPGGNITGLSLLSGDYSTKWLELLKEAAPKVRHVATLWNPDNLGIINQRKRMQESALTLGLQLIALSGAASGHREQPRRSRWSLAATRR